MPNEPTPQQRMAEIEASRTQGNVSSYDGMWLFDRCRKLESQSADMAMLIRRLCNVTPRMKKHDDALDYLHRNGMGGSILRESEAGYGD